MPREGWFAIPGVQSGPRSLEEQMLGLAGALKEAVGQTVLDLGSAEGLIGIEFAKAGAKEVLGIECNDEAVRAARAVRDRLDPELRERIRFFTANLNSVARTETKQYDIVLALAILHKLAPVAAGVEFAARATRKLLVVRLPIGSAGRLISKSRVGSPCDLNQELPRLGLRLEAVVEGPRTELVQYWRR